MTTFDPVRGYRVGQMVTTKVFRSRVCEITQVYVPKRGARVYVLDHAIYVPGDQIIPLAPEGTSK